MGSAPFLGAAHSRETLPEAVDLAVTMAMEQSSETADEAAIRTEIENDNSYYDPLGQWSVCIGTLTP